MSQGTSIGILIGPEKHLLEVHRLHQEMVLLQDGDTLTVPDLLPGWQVVIADLWPQDLTEDPLSGPVQQLTTLSVFKDVSFGIKQGADRIDIISRNKVGKRRIYNF